MAEERERSWSERRRRATRIALVAILILLAFAIGIYVGNNRVEEAFPAEAEVPPASALREGEAGTDANLPNAAAARPDGDWVSIAGRVVSVTGSRFVLDHRTGTVTVELDDWDPAYREAAMLRPGDQVVVTGTIDDNLYLSKRIEADSVFINNVDTLVTASGADEENARRPGYRPPADAYVDLVGEVVETGEDAFLLSAGGKNIRVDARALERRGEIEEGQRLYLWGDMRFDPAAPTLAAKGMMLVKG